jgi:2-C-methyl-D-erythritol 2,4-cyclodiphosphate synthase
VSEQRVGLGVDVHPFVSSSDHGERVLVLGGHTFAGERGLVGNSDADVIAHAVGDGILGAAGLGDLGVHFPESDEAWRGADSIEILRECAALASREGWRLVNGDCTVVCERPKLAPVREEMMRHLSRAAGGPVHVKATRPEGLGSLGRVEGIACLAVVLLER